MKISHKKSAGWRIRFTANEKVTVALCTTPPVPPVVFHRQRELKPAHVHCQSGLLFPVRCWFFKVFALLNFTINLSVLFRPC